MAHSPDIEIAIEKYLDYKEKFEEIQKKMEKYKKNIKTELGKLNTKTYQSSLASVSLQTANKSTISKKEIPSDLWEKYSKKTQYDILQVRKKK